MEDKTELKLEFAMLVLKGVSTCPHCAACKSVASQCLESIKNIDSKQVHIEAKILTS